VLAGPGRMEQNLYHADPASAERFAIVEGRFEFHPLGSSPTSSSLPCPCSIRIKPIERCAPRWRAWRV